MSQTKNMLYVIKLNLSFSKYLKAELRIINNN